MKLFIVTILLLTAISGALAESRHRASIERVYGKNHEALGYRIRTLGDNPELKKAGIQPGDILEFVCGIKLNDSKDFVKADQTLMRGDKECPIIFSRGNERQPFTLDAK